MSAPAAEELLTPTGVLVCDAPPLSPSWYAARRKGITATDVPAALGLSRYRTALHVWLDKRGEGVDEPLGEAGMWGQVLEEPVAATWAAMRDVRVARVGVLARAGQGWMRASLDRLVTGCPDADVCALEVKTRNAWAGADWADDVPDDVLAQVQWQLAVSGLPHAHVVALIGGQRLVQHEVRPEPAVQAYLGAVAARLWLDVQEGRCPALDEHADAWALIDLLNRLHPDRSGTVHLPGRARDLIREYEQRRLAARAEAGEQEKAKARLVALLDNAEVGLLDEMPAVSYRRPKPGLAMPAEQLARLARERPLLAGALQRAGFVVTTTPGPRFTVAGAFKEQP